jgi:hypothetical protein
MDRVGVIKGIGLWWQFWALRELRDWVKVLVDQVVRFSISINNSTQGPLM